jgi:hypothetical protein
VRRGAARWLALCSRRLRGAPDEVGLASAPALAGIDVLHLNAAALRRTADPAASSAVIHVTPRRGKTPRWLTMMAESRKWLRHAGNGSDSLAKDTCVPVIPV